jgi:hypothetical protein
MPHVAPGSQLKGHIEAAFSGLLGNAKDPKPPGHDMLLEKGKASKTMSEIY